MSIRDCRKGGALIAVLVAASLSPFGSWAQQSAEVSGSELQEVIVTAAKRTENLQTVPVSVTALSSATVETQGITSNNSLTTPPRGGASDGSLASLRGGRRAGASAQSATRNAPPDGDRRGRTAGGIFWSGTRNRTADARQVEMSVA
jgi:iron complex outermembrane receptor protein